ncbi:unnamed protein product [Spirodela intermedia]|uniref:Uncharacterized protein n=1 Tax=Spirodela intermedia TaxID=51605 RepID=A0A7I8J6W5_SPIIN|nr:unnamed protein product [Spirodela intermedia]CAA6665794.1 unnamed protein product [Spirodela intermedia]
MVIETVYPGSSAHSTVSTRLFLPSREVKEKAKKIRGSLADDIFSGTASRNILAMTFRQVMLHRVLSFELALFPPGRQRDMENLGSPREIPTELCISSENLSVIAALAEAICSCALECTKRTYLQVEGGRVQVLFLVGSKSPKGLPLLNSTVCVYSIPPNQIIENAQKRLDDFISMKGRPSKEKRKAKHNLWAPPTYSNLDKIGGTGFSDWTNEYIPAYRLQVDGKNLKDVKFKGWQKLPEDRWEVLLTHFQLVELADIMDMYYEDQYTLPTKQLSSSLIAQVSNRTKSERKFSWKMASVILLGGCVLVSLRIMAQIRGQNLFAARISSVPSGTTVSETDYFQPLILDDDKYEALCLSVVQRIQDAVGRHGHISVDRDVGAWVGEIPSCLSKLHISESAHGVSEKEVPARSFDSDMPVPRELSTSELSASQKNSEEDMASSTQDIASYQVALSRDGKVLGFQPTSRTAVPHWASNPLAGALYEGKKLSPGILEPNVKIPQPREVVLVELLMSVNPDSWFVLARPIQ